jgi:signal transduction histidine kinase
MVLEEFIRSHREEILLECRTRANSRNGAGVPPLDLEDGLPLFLEQLGESLRRSSSQAPIDHVVLRKSAVLHGEALFLRGLTIEQVVHDYGDLCQVITSLATQLKVPIAAQDFKSLNLSLDDAIAGAVSEYQRNRERASAHDENERLGIFAHEMRNLLNVAMLTFASIKAGTVAVGGSTGAMHQRTLMRLDALIDRSLAEVRLAAGQHFLERVSVAEIIEEVQISGALFANSKHLSLVVSAVDPSWKVKADRQILAAAIANFLQNAFKFTQPRTTVELRTRVVANRVLIEVEDACGGLPPGATEQLLAPFVQRGNDRSGLGLGLSICVKAMEKIGGEVRILDLPGKGCIFTLDIPADASPLH